MTTQTSPADEVTVDLTTEDVRTHRVTLRIALRNAPGALAAVMTAVEHAGGDVISSQRQRAKANVVFRSITVATRDQAHAEAIGAAVDAIEGLELLALDDDAIKAHEGGKIAIQNKLEIRDRADLALVYTPGVATACHAIAEDPAAAYRLTIKANSVAVVTDGTAVLGLGDIGPLASMPVMEGKAMLFKGFADVDAYPILVDEQDPDLFVDTVARIAGGFGGINLEDISAPRCFEIEGKLRQRLDIPVFHDDQHGTAVVVLAALQNAAKLVGVPLDELRVVLQGVGAAGVAIANLLLAAGVDEIIGLDRKGILTEKRKANDPIRRRLASVTNPRGITGGQMEAFEGAHVFIGVSGPNTVSAAAIERMAQPRLVFALANPIPEIHPAIAGELADVVATGRSDYPNQINNVLCFPGLFRGLLDAAATKITDATKIAAANAIADIIKDEDLAADYIIPSAFDRSVAPAVATAVADQVKREGHVRPGSRGSRHDEAQRHAQQSAQRAVQRSVERRFNASTAKGTRD